MKADVEMSKVGSLLVDGIKVVIGMDKVGWLLEDWMKASGCLDGLG